MHVDRQAAIGGDPAERFDRGASVVHRPFEMRDAADDVDAHIERAVERLYAVLGAVVAVLREGDELQIDIGFHLLAHLDHRLDCHQARIRRVDMTADEQQALA